MSKDVVKSESGLYVVAFRLVDGGERKSQPQVGWRQVKCDGGGTAASVTHSRQALLVR